MSAGQRRQGVPVVKVSQKKGQRYEVDEEALASVLLRPEIRNLPVVVVSVAGAYRGGKSFILDFFLRYLTASRSSQLSSEWLGREDQVLEGFDWRGGSIANTKGIHLWPEPFPVTNEQTGEKFVVLLMDTQGTFDTESDAGDNSTIFALSTLLSSVQIYNLRANIGEDDLQHLQLFTEYGKLACSAEGKAFQTLKFLVRDWMCPYEHPHGYAGGEVLLKRILAPTPTQKKQLREVRDHINSCFEKLQCFLMPHPGLVVADKFFKGRLCDINANFRMSLLELIPSIFEPENLTPKIINGDKVEAQSLLDYFKQYVDIFNKDDLPEATTIYQATAKACMLSALREARSHYESKMESNIIEDQSVSTSMIQNWHNAAVTAAIDHFNSKKKFSAQDTLDTHLKELQKELDARLALYRLQNDAKVRNTVSLAKKSYEECVSSVCDVQARLCLHARDLAALHQRATQQAFAVFDRTRTQVPQEQDGERINLIQDLEQHYQHLSAVNEQNNRSAMLEARNLYLTHMRDQITQAGVTPEMLESQHKKTMAEAVEHFHSYRNQRTEEPEDLDVNQLEQDIEECFVEIEKNNINSNMFAMQMAESTYNTYVTSAWSPQSYCFHPKGLAELHKAARKRALEQFLNERVESEQDIFKEKLITKLDTRHEELKVNNTYNNRQAVEQALSEYRRLMDGLKLSQTNFIVAIIRKLFKWTDKRHDAARKSALQVFAVRRLGGNYNDDEYLTDLKERIEGAYGDYNVW